jgi:hypothetical protein
MPSVPNSPLNDEHLQQINAALAAIQVAETQTLLAKQAGLDVSAHEKDIADAKTRLRAIKNTYFPGSM